MKAEAVNKLEETIYYQGSHGIENYLDEFQILIFNAIRHGLHQGGSPQNRLGDEWTCGMTLALVL